MEVILYNNTSNPNVMTKSITSVGTYNTDPKGDIDVENPVIYLSGAIPSNANYMQISDLGRYYYIKAVTRLGNAFEVVGQSDPLMSFKSAILASPAVIARNPWHFDLYVPDPKLPIEARTVSSVIPFTQNPFSGTDNCYILTTLGSG